MAPLAVAQEKEADRITEQDKKAFREFMDGRKQKARLPMVIMNLRQIGLALFEFETEYEKYPCEGTVPMVKEAKRTVADVKAVTANDCFYQLIAAGIVEQVDIFTLARSPAPGKFGKDKIPPKLEKCAFSSVFGMNAAGNPSRPLVVAPLVKGKTVFDPNVLGGKAVVLCVDNSVRSFAIEKDGRVMIEGRDIFDPAQPFWDGKVPPIKWPED